MIQKTNNRIAVVLFNLGGPDSLEAVEPFLFNLFFDKSIITLPRPLRWLVAKLISKRRKKTAINIYAQMGGASPILDNTKKQADALMGALSSALPEYEINVYIVMRYWGPRCKNVVTEVQNFDPGKIVLLPLYPQFSTTTTGSSMMEWRKYYSNRNSTSKQNTQLYNVCCYFLEENFLAAQRNLIKERCSQLEKNKTVILFSAHGLPEKIVQNGDPYQWQIEKCVKAIMQDKLLEDWTYKISYQSRVGPVKWIGPSTDEEIKAIGQNNKNVILVPISFVSEHSETLVELDIEYNKLAKACGIKEYVRVPTLGNNIHYITCLSRLVQNTINNSCASSGGQDCANNFKGCPSSLLNSIV